MSTENHEPAIDISPWLDELSPKRMSILVQRALREARLEEVPEEDSYDMEEKFIPAFIDAAKLMCVREILDEMTEDGITQVTGVNEDGYLTYALTEEGYQLYEATKDE